MSKQTESTEEPLISVRNVSKKYCKSLHESLWYGVKDIASELLVRRAGNGSLRANEFWALKDITFDLHRGESLAIIGANGAGKSTLLKLLNGLIKPDVGEIQIKGNIGAMIELGAGFDTVLSGRENIYVRAALLGISRKEVSELVDQIIEFAELEKFIDSPIQYYSSGMVARLSFAVSAYLRPDILLVDEILAVGDLDFQRKCTNRMLEYLSSGGSVILVSHNPNHIQSICKHGVLLENGNVDFQGTSVETLDKYFQNQLNKVSSNQRVISDNKLPEKESLAIKEIILEPVNGKIIQTGKDCQLRVKYISSECFENVVFGFSIWTHDNWINVTGNYDMTPRTIQKGCGEFYCVIPKLPLLSGTYLLKVVIGEVSSLQTITSSGWNDTPLEFKVQSEPNLKNNLLQQVNQLMLINVCWYGNDKFVLDSELNKKV